MFKQIFKAFFLFCMLCTLHPHHQHVKRKYSFYFETLCEKSFEEKCCKILLAFNFKVAKSASRRRSWFRINFMGPSPILSWMCFELLHLLEKKDVEGRSNSIVDSIDHSIVHTKEWFWSIPLHCPPTFKNIKHNKISFIMFYKLHETDLM